MAETQKCEHPQKPIRIRYGNGEADQYYLVCPDCDTEVDHQRRPVRNGIRRSILIGGGYDGSAD